MRMQNADAAGLVAEGHQLLAEDFEKARCVREFHGHADRMPEAAHVLAHRCAGAGFGQLRIVLGDAVGVVAAIGLEVFFRWFRCGLGLAERANICIHHVPPLGRLGHVYNLCIPK